MGPRVTDAERQKWKRLYEDEGMTIEAIGLQVGRASNTIALGLHTVGTQMRTPSESTRGRKAPAAADGVRGKPSSGLPRGIGRQTISGHRRRSGR